MAFKVFREEYEGFLDVLLEDDRFLYLNKLVKRPAEIKDLQAPSFTYTLESTARALVEGTIKGDTEDSEGLIGPLPSKEEIQKDKILIELIENPKKLWKHLVVSIRNVWIHRVILVKRIKYKLSELEEEMYPTPEAFQAAAHSKLLSANFSGQFWQKLKPFLVAEIKNSRSLFSLQKSLKLTAKTAFQAYFYGLYIGNTQKRASKGPRKRLRKLDDDLNDEYL